MINRNIIGQIEVIKGTTCLGLEILGTNLLFKWRVTSLLVVAIYTKHDIGKINITSNMRTNCILIFYAP
jgi:hypothetical protein